MSAPPPPAPTAPEEGPPPPPPRSVAARSKSWAASLARKHTPTREEMASNRYLAPFAHRVLSPELWRFTRRSVPRGVALGLFAAFIFPLGQILISTFLALPTRANVPLAALVTFVTNPFTLPFWLVLANRLGTLVLDISGSHQALMAAAGEGSMWAGWGEASALAGTTLVGYLVLSFLTPPLGYLVSGWIWRGLVARKRANRLKGMEARLDRRLGTQ